jgi:D-Tyr-tRNAtyr deacylase
VVVSHYWVNLGAISTGYVVFVGVGDEADMNRVDTLATLAANILTEDFMEFLFPEAPPAGGPKV